MPPALSPEDHPALTLDEIKGRGFTHLSGWCEACRVVRVVLIDSFMGRVAPRESFRAIARRARCRTCGAPMQKVVAEVTGSQAAGTTFR